MSLRSFSLALADNPQRLSDVYGDGAGIIRADHDIPYHHLILSASTVDAFVGDFGAESDAYAAQVLKDGASVYWRLDEASGNFIDEISGQVATPSGAVTYRQPGALANGNPAVQGDGTSGLITGPSITLGLPFSMECWVNQRVTQASNVRMLGVYGVTFAKFLTNGATHVPAFFVGGTIIGASSTLLVGIWHHLVGMGDGVNISLYVDGALVATAANAQTPTPSALIWLGGDGLFFDGRMDEVAIYPTALTAQQVANHFQLAQAVFGPTESVRLKADGAPLALGLSDAGPLKLSNLSAAGAGSTLRILGVPY